MKLFQWRAEHEPISTLLTDSTLFPATPNVRSTIIRMCPKRRRSSTGYSIVEQSGRVLEESTASSSQKSAQEMHVSSHSRVSDKVGEGRKYLHSLIVYLRHCLGLWHCIREALRSKHWPNFTRISDPLCLDRAGKTFPYGQELVSVYTACYPFKA